MKAYEMPTLIINVFSGIAGVVKVDEVLIVVTSTRFLLRESKLAASVVFLGAGEGEVWDEYA